MEGAVLNQSSDRFLVLTGLYLQKAELQTLVKAMGFPVVVCGCKSWTIKKAEHQRIDAFELSCDCMFLGFCLITTKIWSDGTMVLEKTLESPLDCKEIKPVNRKGNQF